LTVTREDRPIQVLWSAPDFAAGTARPSGSGIPILFPFPGRIQGTVLRWEGRDYPLKEGDNRGNAIHGFVLNRPWRVVEQAPHRVVGEFQAGRDDVSLLQAWPADFCIRVSYELRCEKLTAVIDVRNPDSRPLPCGLGTHPYFRVPLGGPHGDDCIVKLPVSAQWELRDMIATGIRSELPNSREFQQGRPFRELTLDNVFCGLRNDGGWIRSQVSDPASRLLVEQSFDSTFRECVVYTPPHREAICIEPYTCVPGCFDLAARGIDSGVKVLAPGESFQSRIEIRVQ
jgi:aldose 1-epimerase